MRGSWTPNGNGGGKRDIWGTRDKNKLGSLEGDLGPFGGRKENEGKEKMKRKRVIASKRPRWASRRPRR